MEILNICKICGYEFDNSNLEESIEEHLWKEHFLRYQDYYEVVATESTFTQCWKCGSTRYTLSPYLESIYLPCSNCIESETKRSLKEMQDQLWAYIDEYENTIIRNKFYQYFLSMDVNERSRLLPRIFKTQSDMLGELKRLRKTKFDKSHLIKITNKLGSTPEISTRNMKNLDIETLEFRLTKTCDGRYKLGDLDLYVSLPEVIPYDYRHHSRYSLLNPSSKRSSKRLKLESNECIKLGKTQNPVVRCILGLTNTVGERVNLEDLDSEIKWKIKFGILKTKEILSRVFEVYNELLKYIDNVKDSVFLLNSVKLPFQNNNIEFIFTWSSDEQKYEIEENKIKLSILS